MEKRNARFCHPKERLKLVSLVAPQNNNNRKRMCPGSKSHQDNQNTNTTDTKEEPKKKKKKKKTKKKKEKEKDQLEGISYDKPNDTRKSGQKEENEQNMKEPYRIRRRLETRTKQIR
jgi:hypothetical protein